LLREEKVSLKNILVTGLIVVLSHGVGVISTSAGSLGLPQPQSIEENSATAQISPEIRTLLQDNNLRPAQYQTPAPDFILSDLDGNEVRLNQFRGETVLLGFFTTW
jgi:cytochrome oxidase Cu insertion factor (SCO1/SenC/PrrC family)